MQTLISHIEFNATDYRRSILFYDLVMPFMGFKRTNCTRQYTAYTDGGSKVILTPTEDRFLSEPFHRKKPGLNHLAFYTPSMDKVDEFQRFLCPIR